MPSERTTLEDAIYAAAYVAEYNKIRRERELEGFKNEEHTRIRKWAVIDAQNRAEEILIEFKKYKDEGQ